MSEGSEETLVRELRDGWWERIEILVSMLGTMEAQGKPVLQLAPVFLSSSFQGGIRFFISTGHKLKLKSPLCQRELT